MSGALHIQALERDAVPVLEVRAQRRPRRIRRISRMNRYPARLRDARLHPRNILILFPAHLGIHRKRRMEVRGQLIPPRVQTPGNNPVRRMRIEIPDEIIDDVLAIDAVTSGRATAHCKTTQEFQETVDECHRIQASVSDKLISIVLRELVKSR